MRRGLLPLLLLLAVATGLAVSTLDVPPPDASARSGPAGRAPPDRAGKRAASGPVRVVDGDTLDLDGARIRLHGIDAPERAQRCTAAAGRAWPCGREATLALTRMVAGRRPLCTERDRDGYGRSVAVCTVDGRDINRAMVAAGWAVAYTRYSRDYEGDEAAARRARLGVWQGGFERPDVYRAERRGGRG